MTCGSIYHIAQPRTPTFWDSVRRNCRIQIDIGFGDAVTPGPEDVDYHMILAGFAAPKLRAHPRYRVVAEKVEALSSLGIANSRMKDYFDLWILVQYTDYYGDIRRRAVQSTFDSRNTALPRQPPFGLTVAFAQDVQKKAQWRAFLQKNRLETLDLGDVIAALATFVLPVIEAINADEAIAANWQASGPWSPADTGQFNN